MKAPVVRLLGDLQLKILKKIITILVFGKKHLLLQKNKT